jgi:hypothetical protein
LRWETHGLVIHGERTLPVLESGLQCIDLVEEKRHFFHGQGFDPPTAAGEIGKFGIKAEEDVNRLLVNNA